jgi:hypothetical protein
MSGQKEYDGSRIYLSLAGSGDPWSSLTKFRKRILRELHDTPDISSLASMLDKTPDELKAEIHPMMVASLVREVDGGFRPSFLVTDESETQRVFAHASSFAEVLADKTEEDLPWVKSEYEKLEISQEHGFEELSLFFLGGRILDIKLLEKLTEHNRVMPPAPARPSPNRPNAHYYFYMVEGDPKNLGGWGQDDTNMPWDGWYFITFGQNLIDREYNPHRKSLEKRYEELIESGTADTPESVGASLGIPVVSLSDSNMWENTASFLAEELCGCYEESEESIKALHKDLRSGTYAPQSIGEFFCWYAHIAYASAIEMMEERGILDIPRSRFQSAIWCRAREREGLLAHLPG